MEAKRDVIADYLRLDAAGDLLARGIVEDILRGVCSAYTEHPDYSPRGPNAVEYGVGMSEVDHPEGYVRPDDSLGSFRGLPGIARPG